MSSIPDIPSDFDASKPLGTNDPALRRGWFYRTVAPGPDKPVLAVGAPFARRWFPNVTEGSLFDASATYPPASFGLVIIHATLGGCPSLVGALRAACDVLAPSGVVVLSGYNRLRPEEGIGSAAESPRATPWGYRHAARTAGFGELELFVARPTLETFTSAFSTARASARAFYRFERASQRASGSARWTRAREWMTPSGLAAWLESAFVVVARKC